MKEIEEIRAFYKQAGCRYAKHYLKVARLHQHNCGRLPDFDQDEKVTQECQKDPQYRLKSQERF